MTGGSDDGSSTAGPGRVRRVLVLDDDEMLLRVWARAARSLASVDLVLVATVAAARAELARSPTFDLVVCDFHIGASETSEALVRELRGRALPVVVVSGDADGARAALEHADVAVTSKPHTWDELSSLLATEVEHRRTSG